MLIRNVGVSTSAHDAHYAAHHAPDSGSQRKALLSSWGVPPNLVTQRCGSAGQTDTPTSPASYVGRPELRRFGLSTCGLCTFRSLGWSAGYDRGDQELASQPHNVPVRAPLSPPVMLSCLRGHDGGHVRCAEGGRPSAGFQAGGPPAAPAVPLRTGIRTGNPLTILMLSDHTGEFAQGDAHQVRWSSPKDAAV